MDDFKMPYGKIQWNSLRFTFRPFNWSNKYFVPGHIPMMPTYRLGPFEVSWFRYPTEEEVVAQAAEAKRELSQ